MLTKPRGFTIVELLIVIVVIAILAAISVVAYNGIQQRATASAIINDAKSLDKAFHLLATQDAKSTWWIENEFTGSSNPKIENVISNSDLINYFQTLSPSTVDSTTKVVYDNDGDANNGCNHSASAVNIIFFTIDEAIVQSIDDEIDDGDPSCGNVAYTTTGNMLYRLSLVQSL